MRIGIPHTLTRFAEPCGEAAARDQALDRPRLALLQPGQDREVVRRIERDQIRGVSLDQRRDDALRRDLGDAGDRGDLRSPSRRARSRRSAAR